MLFLFVRESSTSHIGSAKTVTCRHKKRSSQLNKGDRGLGHLMMTIAQVGSKAGFFILGEEEIIY